MGDIINKPVFAELGNTVSFINSLAPSAKGCSRPNKPTMFGPDRRCIEAINLRSNRVRQATAINRGKTKIRNFPTDDKIEIMISIFDGAGA